MNGRSLSVLKMALIVGFASACGEPQVSNLTYDEVSKAAHGRDAAAYRSYFADIRGQRVAWSGRVVDVKTERGDEFMEVGVLVVDLDGAAPGEDAILQVSASTAEDMAAGQEVKFTGLIRDFEWTKQRPLLRLEVNDVQ